jgi:fused signal recognition particle receptor
MAIWERLRAGLARTRAAMRAQVAAITGGRTREAFLEAVEVALLAADVGVETTEAVLDRLRRTATDDLRGALLAELGRLAGPPGGFPRPLGEPHTVLLVGVNGAGKTTTAAKLAAKLRAEGRSVLFGAADTFRAAAAEQLAVWSERLGAEIVRHQPGSDPAAVAHDAIAAALARGRGAVFIDTAGRLQNKAHLMEELGKVGRVVERALGRPPDEVLLVIDAVTGQNAVRQAEVFASAVPVNGIVVTKLDGSARGGAVLAAHQRIGAPIRWVGTGEGVDDLWPFDPQAFAAALVEGLEVPDAAD